MKFDFSELKGKIVAKFGPRAAFATAMGFNNEQLSRRLNNRTSFTMDEIYRAMDLLGISPKDISIYFFTPKVR